MKVDSIVDDIIKTSKKPTVKDLLRLDAWVQKHAIRKHVINGKEYYDLNECRQDLK